jgi:two-component system, cell cycle sensor histidine kinase and response regulator CckA
MANPKMAPGNNTSFPALQPPGLLQSILDQVGVALAVIDSQRRFVFTNQAALKIFGAIENLSLAEWRRGIHKVHDSRGGEIPPGQSPVLRALDGEQVEPHEVRVTFHDGRSKWMHVAAHPFSVLGLAGVLAVVTDETEQVELRKALERLQRTEEIGILAGGLAHDFNNVLSALSENVALALSDQAAPQTTRSRLQQMQAALQQGALLTKRLMQYSRRQEPHMRFLEINDVVNAALDLMRPLLKKPPVHVETTMSEGLPGVEGDFSRLEQVIVNLILNALDAMPEGGELSIHTELVSGDAASPLPGEAVSTAESEANDQFVLVSVADTGIGIPKHLQASIFEPFFTTKPPGKGTGLGLSIAQTTVRQHKGHIKLLSTPGSGTRVSIYLPVRDAR